MPHRAPPITCPKCNGSGKVFLTRPLAHAFHFVRENPGCATKDYHDRLLKSDPTVTPVAAQNRLNALREFGLLERRKENGRFRFYETQPPTIEHLRA